MNSKKTNNCNSIPDSSCKDVCEHFERCIDDYGYELRDEILTLKIKCIDYEQFINSIYHDLGDYLYGTERSDDDIAPIYSRD